MDGDFAPIDEMIVLSKKMNFYLIVDEAHATGYLGKKGRGLTYPGINENYFARIITFGKAYGYHGAAILGSKDLISFLVNFSRSFIYTTALPTYAFARIIATLDYHQKSLHLIKQLNNIIEYFEQNTFKIPYLVLKSNSAIRSIIIPGNNQVKLLADKLQKNNLAVVPILYPTVPLGKERLRITLHSFNTIEEVDFLLSILSNE
jgi:8-amino-7-oxononanoate synthase